MEYSRRNNVTYLLLTLEAFIAGFYVIITRSLAPIFFTIVGFNVKDIIKLNIIGYLFAIALAITTYYRWDHIKHNVKAKLVLFHACERIAWGMIPIVAAFSIELLYLDYALAIALTIPTSIGINMILYGVFDEYSAKRLIARRSALSSLSSVIGQVVVVLVLSIVQSQLKYVYLYTLATLVGLLATITILISNIPRDIAVNRNSTLKASNGDEEVKIVNVFLLLVLFLSSNAIISITWPPYLIRELGTPDYFVAMLGLIQTLTAIFSSLFWLKKSYNTYRLAVFGVASIPLLIALSRSPTTHLMLAVLYSFMTTGANLLASFIYADTAKRVTFSKAITLLTSTSALAQVVGLSIIYFISTNLIQMFMIASILQVITAVIAATTIPEVAIAPERYVRMYSRLLYNISVSSYNFTLMTTKNTILLTLRLIGFSIVATILYMIYKVLFYLISLSSGVT